MGEIVIKEIVLNPNIECNCFFCKRVIKKDYPKIKVNMELSDTEKMNRLFINSVNIGFQGGLFRKRQTPSPNIPKENDEEIICIKCFFKALKDKKEVNEAFEREINNWIEANKSRLTLEEL